MIGGYSAEAIAKPLHPYQVEAVKFELERLLVRPTAPAGRGLFLDPGLGKTRISLTVADVLFEMGVIEKALIVAPLRPILITWPEEIRKWGFPFSFSILHGQHKQALAQNCQLELVNFEGLVKLEELRHRWDLLIVDESPYIKNWSTKRMKYLRKLIKTIPNRMILTGTPASNSLVDLHSQVFVLDDGEALGKTAGFFRKTYCEKGGYYDRQWVVKEDRKDELLGKVKPLCLRMQAEDYLDMPALVINDICCELPPPAVKRYKQLKRELYTQLETGDIWCTSAGAAYSKCKQFANGTVYSAEPDGSKVSHKAHDAKIQALLDLFEELAGKPLLVFYHFSQDLRRLQGLRQFAKAPTIRGRMSTKQVQPILEGWNRGDFPIILAQWQAASHGLNMQGACNDVACFGLVDSLDTYDQAIRRVYRQGVKGHQVRIHRLLTRGTVDETMRDRLAGKFETQDQFLQALKLHARSGI